MYLPALQNYQSGMTLVVRTAGDPKALVAGVRSEIQRLDKNLPVTDVKTLVDHMGIALFPARMAATLLSVFGLLALVLAAVGIYGVTSYAVSQRTREIGVRIALGARQSDVFQLVIGHGVLLAALGVGVGLAAAFAVTRLLASWLYDVSVTDPVTFAGVPVVLGAVALMASYVPARRAMRVDPITALRYE